jgi:hypothetical protein
VKIRFGNGVVNVCSAPIEQKLFQQNGGTKSAVGWLLTLRVFGEMTSSELDDLLAEKNIKSLEFLTENEAGEDKVIFTLTNYINVTSSVIHHSDNTTETYAEIQLLKGV